VASFTVPVVNGPYCPMVFINSSGLGTSAVVVTVKSVVFNL
jgi:hypothetical protein